MFDIRSLHLPLAALPVPRRADGGAAVLDCHAGYGRFTAADVLVGSLFGGCSLLRHL